MILTRKDRNEVQPAVTERSPVQLWGEGLFIILKMKKQKKRLMSESDLKLYRESVIRECNIKLKPKKSNKNWNTFFKALKIITPVTIIIGVVAAIIYVKLNGWNQFLELILTGIIWITLISTFISGISKLEKN